MLPTQSGGPGAFVDFDLNRVPTPCYVVDEQKIRANLEVLRDIGDRSGAKVLLALKAFAMWSLAGLVDEYLDGCCASGLWEARLAREKGFLGARKSQVLSTFSPAYRPSEFTEICSISDHVIFNRPSADGVGQARVTGVSVGLRINPEISLGLDQQGLNTSAGIALLPGNAGKEQVEHRPGSWVSVVIGHAHEMTRFIEVTVVEPP